MTAKEITAWVEKQVDDGCDVAVGLDEVQTLIAHIEKLEAIVDNPWQLKAAERAVQFADERNLRWEEGAAAFVAFAAVLNAEAAKE